ncbi:MAG: hypothetical protein LBJ63_01340 [Prevotellaceae bacterium]|jgi:outer membrane murein-binding lipoprotein Lpp|nr:hypothetical protein [Prevotellaceae bacterium]
MKKLLTIACICAGFALAGCSSDDGNDNTPANSLTIDARVENGNDYNSQIDSVRAFVNDNDTEVVATAEYVNGGFTLTLPANIDSRHLNSITVPSGLKVSDRNMKITVIDAYGFVGVKSGQITGEFHYIHTFNQGTHDLVSAHFFYVDRNATWDGTYIDDDGDVSVWDNVSFKKGWNTVYYTVIHHNDNTNTTTYSTTKPNVIKWHYFTISGGI